MTHFEWDDQKAERNRLKHGVTFQDAASALMGLTMTQPNQRDGENRFMSFCESGGRVITVIWTPRPNAIRIISARAARTNEQAYYHESVRRSAEAREH